MLFSVFLFGPLLFSNLITFLIFIHLKRFKSVIGVPLEIFTNHLKTLITVEQRTRNFLSVQELTFVVFGDLFLLSS